MASNSRSKTDPEFEDVPKEFLSAVDKYAVVSHNEWNDRHYWNLKNSYCPDHGQGRMCFIVYEPDTDYNQLRCRVCGDIGEVYDFDTKKEEDYKVKKAISNRVCNAMVKEKVDEYIKDDDVWSMGKKNKKGIQYISLKSFHCGNTEHTSKRTNGLIWNHNDGSLAIKCWSTKCTFYKRLI